LFISWRKIIQGYDGYEYPPDFADKAKEMLIGEGGKEKF